MALWKREENPLWVSVDTLKRRFCGCCGNLNYNRNLLILGKLCVGL